MKFSDLSKEDQALLSTDFGDLDKVAAEQVKVANEMYEAGVELALSTADEMDKLAASAGSSDDLSDSADESEKVAAADYGNIIAEGYIDKLAALGVERHGDADHYFLPLVEEKIAEAGRMAALKKFWDATKSKASGAAAKAKDMASKAKAQAGQAGQRAGDFAKGQAKRHSEGAKDVMTGLKGKTEHITGLSAGERARRVGMGVGKMAPGLAAGGLAAGGGLYAATRGKKED